MMTNTVESLQAQVAELLLKTQQHELRDVLRDRGFDPKIAELMSRDTEIVARLRAGESVESVAANVARNAPPQFRARKPVDGAALKAKFEAVHAEAAEKRLDAISELRRKLGTTR
jgi:hypothetical protein